MIAFGPVPSRRLGRSLGINNIPPKVCSYSCVYCQVGRTTDMRVERKTFYSTWEILQAAQARLSKAATAGERIDYVTLVPDGEPTLDVNLGRTIDRLKAQGTPVAVITNSSLMARDDVREDLMRADWVSVKVDSVRPEAWRRVNRPHGSLKLDAILEGVVAFERAFPGTLVTETMLVAGLNDRERQVQEVAEYLGAIQPSTAYISIPTRPPAEPWARAPSEETVVRAHRILAEKVRRVECLIGYEGNEFASTGDVAQDLLDITAVHPMREEAVAALLAGAGADWSTVDALIAGGQLVESPFEGHRYYIRKAPTSASRRPA